MKIIIIIFFFCALHVDVCADYVGSWLQVRHGCLDGDRGNPVVSNPVTIDPDKNLSSIFTDTGYILRDYECKNQCMGVDRLRCPRSCIILATDEAESNASPNFSSSESNGSSEFYVKDSTVKSVAFSPGIFYHFIEGIVN